MKKSDNKSAAVEIIRRLRDRGHAAYLVGGCVRDMLLERKNPREEYDVATAARVEDVTRLFARTLLVGAKFGVVLVGLGGQWIEVASFRSDESYSDGRHPDAVRIGSLQEDAERRDFTVNGMYFDPLENKLIDLVGGRADIERRLLRAIGEPDRRFAEDHLRMLRAVRFAGQLKDFTIEKQTAAAIRRLADRITGISAERILEELKKILACSGRVRALRLADGLGLLKHVLPEVYALHDTGDAFDETLAVLDQLPGEVAFDVAMAALLHRVGASLPVPADYDHFPVRSRPSPREFTPSARIAGAVCRRLTCSNEERTGAVWLVQLLPLFQRPARLSLAAAKRLMLYGRFEGLLALYRARVAAGCEPHENLERIEALAGRINPATLREPPLITGRDLSETLGLVPGPRYQKILDAVYDAQLEEKITTRREALALARKISSEENHRPSSRKGSNSGPKI
jgi:tRNA nucleotidyltransferase/poly(A) polymerase